MFKIALKFTLRFFALLALLAALLFGWLKATAATVDGLPPLKNGDLVFQTSRSNQSIAIMLASKSPYSHMGIVDILPTGQAVVLEAVATGRETPLTDWVSRGGGGRLLVKRWEQLSPTQAQAITMAARSHFGKPTTCFSVTAAMRSIAVNWLTWPSATVPDSPWECPNVLAISTSTISRRAS